MTQVPGGQQKFLLFTAVSVIGTAADFLLALGLHNYVGLAAVAASAIGFSLGTCINYLGHHYITFASDDGQAASMKGFGKYAAAVAASLVVRLAVVFGLDTLGVLPFWLVLIVAIGASFICSYLISLLWVFKKKA